MDPLEALGVEHPLLNSVILDKVFIYMQPSVDELKSYRLVCKFWHATTLSIWRKTAVINIIPDTPLFEQKPANSIGAYKLLQEYENSQSFYQFAKKPFASYKFSEFTIDPKACENDEESSLFWSRLGPHMEHVQFKRCEFIDEDGTGFVNLLASKTPNIKELILSFISSKAAANPSNNIEFKKAKFSHTLPHLKLISFQGRVYFRKGLNQLIQSVPNLERITGVDRIGYESEFDDPIRAIASASQDNPGCLNNLKHLDFINSTAVHRNSCWSYLSNSHIKLETLTARLSPDTYNFHEILSRGIEDFLISQRKSLEVLEVFRNQYYEPFDQFLERFQMPGLTKLKLLGNVAKNFHFLKSTPSLQELYINLNCYEKWADLKLFTEISRNSKFKPYTTSMVSVSNENLMQGVMLTHLKSLHVTFDFSVDCWKFLGSWIPNLEKLNAVLNTKTVSVICSQWQNLSQLVCLHESCIDDKSVTGDTSDTEKLTAIVDLKNLEKFELNALCNGSNLTDVSVQSGFLKMGALKYLTICVSSNVTAETEKLLCEKIVNCRVIRNYTNGNHSNYDCCKRKQFNQEASQGFKKVERLL